MSYIQRHLKNNDSTERAHHHQPLQPYPLRNKKNLPVRIKTECSFQKNNRSKRKDEPIKKHTPEVSYRQREQQAKPAARNPVRFATQGPGSTESVEQPIKAIFKEADNSMQEMLNSSMSHFDHFLKSRDQISVENSQLVEQNQHLRGAVEELMSILRSKLDKALRKQEKEMKGVMSDYLQLITKLLADKEELTNSLQKAEKTITQQQKHIKTLEHQVRIHQERESKSSQRHIYSINIMEDAEPDAADCEVSLQQKINQQNHKIQTLYELLERSEKEKKRLQDGLNRMDTNESRYKCLEDEFEARIAQLQKEHEEQFIQYERAMREALGKKDETIARLNRLIEGRHGAGNCPDAINHQDV